MNRWVIYGVASLLFVAGLFIYFDKRMVNAAREMVGMEPLYLSETRDMSTEDRAAEMARIAALPVPGLVDEPPTLGKASAVVIECTSAHVARVPQGASRDAVERYLLTLAATGLDRESPLIEPELHPLYLLMAQGPMAVLDEAANGMIAPRYLAMLAEFHATYSDPDHPLYDGLQLYSGTFDALQFEEALAVLAGSWRAMSDCATADLLPPLAEWRVLKVE